VHAVATTGERGVGRGRLMWARQEMERGMTGLWCGAGDGRAAGDGGRGALRGRERADGAVASGEGGNNKDEGAGGVQTDGRPGLIIIVFLIYT
jgi:hypothetical protein